MPINGCVLEIIMFQRQEKKYINMYIYIYDMLAKILECNSLCKKFGRK